MENYVDLGVYKRITEREKLSYYLEGTCQSLDNAIERLELDPDVDWEDEMLSANMETCLGCGWWHSSGDLVHENEEDIGYCDQCKGEDE